jgi:ComEC/Rec2-related protein
MEHMPALFLLLGFISGRIWGVWGFAIVALGMVWYWKPLKVCFILASFVWGTTLYEQDTISQRQWEAWSQEKGYLKCQFEWLEDVYPIENNLAKGWASLIPMEGDRPCVSLARKAYLSCPKQGDDSNYFSGCTWTGYLSFREGQSIKFFKTGHAENRSISNLMAWRRSLILLLERRWENIPQEIRGFLRSLCTGNRRELSDSLRQHYQRLGLMALLAISGLHLALVYGLVFSWFGFLQRCWPQNSQSIWLCKPSFWACLAVLVYAALGGWSVPLLRALGMVLLARLAIGLGRRYVSWNGLFFMAWLELIINPSSWLSVSYLLTYLGVAGIFWFRQCWVIRIQSKSLKNLWQAYGLSWGAMLWTWPLTVMYFGTFPSWGWLLGPLFFATFAGILFYVLLLILASLVISCPAWVALPLTLYHQFLEWCSNHGAWVCSVKAGESFWIFLYYGSLLGLLWTQQKSKTD